MQLNVRQFAFRVAMLLISAAVHFGLRRLKLNLFLIKTPNLDWCNNNSSNIIMPSKYLVDLSL